MAAGKTVRLGVLLVFTTLIALPLAQVSAQEQTLRVTVDLNEVEDSGISGTAVLTAAAEGVEVVMELGGAELDGDHPTHIHTGTCDDFDPNPLYPLETVVLSSVDDQGLSDTMLDDVALETLWDGEYVILVHQSAEELTSYLVCGEIANGTLEQFSSRGQNSSDDDEGDGEQGEDVSTHVSRMPHTGAGVTAAPEHVNPLLLVALIGVVSLSFLLGGIALRLRRS